MTAFLLAQLVVLVDEAPEPEDVKAGWMAFVVLLLLIAAVAFLGFSLTKHLRKAQAAEEAGLYGSDEAAKDAGDAETPDTETEPHQAP
jgi:hypothetical protein